MRHCCGFEMGYKKFTRKILCQKICYMLSTSHGATLFTHFHKNIIDKKHNFNVKADSNFFICLTNKNSKGLSYGTKMSWSCLQAELSLICCYLVVKDDNYILKSIKNGAPKSQSNYFVYS